MAAMVIVPMIEAHTMRTTRGMVGFLTAYPLIDLKVTATTIAIMEVDTASNSLEMAADIDTDYHAVEVVLVAVEACRSRPPCRRSLSPPQRFPR